MIVNITICVISSNQVWLPPTPGMARALEGPTPRYTWPVTVAGNAHIDNSASRRIPGGKPATVAPVSIALLTFPLTLCSD